MKIRKHVAADRHRAWLYFYSHPEANAVQALGFEWYFGKRARHCGIAISFNVVDGDRGIRFYAGIPWLFNLYFTVERVPEWMLPWHWEESSLRPGEKFRYPEKRSIGVRVSGWTVWVSLWENEMEWSRDDPWWWKFNINLADLFLGQAKHTRSILAKGECNVPMPEGGYSACYTITASKQKRPRWPWAKRWLYVDIEIDSENGIPLPGKGENSWDCDDDAVYASGRELTGSVDDACADLARSIVQDRVKLCGREVYP